MTDFYVKEYPNPKQRFGADDPILPLNFYDNDDGFWDVYIKHKYDKWGSNQMIVNRPFIKH